MGLSFRASVPEQLSVESSPGCALACVRHALTSDMLCLLLLLCLQIMGFLETKRYQGFKETGSSGLINQFPFDPAGMNSKDMQVKEVKNGRLAMVSASIGLLTPINRPGIQPLAAARLGTGLIAQYGQVPSVPGR